MEISRRYGVSANSVLYRGSGQHRTASLFEHADQDLWPLRRAVWFWIGLSALCWTLIAGLIS